MGEEFTKLIDETSGAAFHKAGSITGTFMLVQAFWGKAASAMTLKDQMAGLEQVKQIIEDENMMPHPKLLLVVRDKGSTTGTTTPGSCAATDHDNGSGTGTSSN